MSVLFQQPQWLWLALAIVPVVVVGWWTFATMTGLRRTLALLLRTALLLTLCALLAGLSSMTTTNKLAVVAVVDVSGSVQRFFRPSPEQAQALGLGDAGPRPTADAAVRSFLQRALWPLGQEDLAGLVVFDGRALAAAAPARTDVARREFALQPVAGTNIAQALRLATSMVPPDAAGRILLLSDGNQTAGDALAAARELTDAQANAAQGRARVGTIALDVVPLPFRLGNEVVVEAVDAPPRAAAGATVNIRVVLWSSGESTGTLRLLRDSEVVDINGIAPGEGQRVRLRAGRNVELVEVELGPGRVHRFSAVYEPDVGADGTLLGDNVLENNRAQAFTISPGRGSVLLVQGGAGIGAASTDGAGAADGGASPLAATLRRAGLEVTVTTPAGVPTDVLALEAFDMIVLENVPAADVDPFTQEQLVAFVRDMGGGLAMVGGPNSFGAGGWKGSAIAPILPVELELPDRVVAPEVATVFVIDNSGSMDRPVLGSIKSQQQIANDATALAIASLDRNDMVGVIVFNSVARVVVPLDRNTDPRPAIERVRAIQSDGGTDIAAGLELAIDQLRNVRAKVKHVVVLSDGKSQRDSELPGLASQLASMGVKISSIIVGDDADVGQLERIAQIGGGVAYNANNATALPRIFLRAIRVVRSPLLREADFTPVLLPVASPMTAGLGASADIPPLGGMVLTRPRPEPTITLAMVAPTGEPLLAHWNVGLGQVAAFTSDAGEWASRWLEWPGYERLWTQLIRSASRPATTRNIDATLSAEDGVLAIRAQAIDDAGLPASGLALEASVFTPAGQSISVPLRATGPGTYEAQLDATQTGSYIALVKPRDTSTVRMSAAIAGTTLQEGAEFRALRSDEQLLAQLASAGGGRVLDLARPEEANLFDRTGLTPARAIEPRWQELLLLALALLLLDIANRRVAWDRFFSAAFRERVAQGVQRGAGAAAASVGTLRERRSAAPATGPKLTLDGAGAASPAPAPSLTLDEQDAARLAAAARDRRRQQRLEAMTPASASPLPDAATPAPRDAGTGEGSGLLAAKRRAAQRFDEPR